MNRLPGEPIIPIKIPTPFAVGPVFCYLIRDEKTVLVDCGHNEDKAHNVLKNTLHDYGVDLEDIDEIWLTHGHPDHFGQAARLADKTGAVVYGHRKERANFACNRDRELFADFFEHHGIPQRAIQQMVEQLDWLQQYQQPLQPEWIREGETLSTGELEFEVLHMPGHSAGHLIFREKGGVILGGDLLLEHITTNALINFDPDSNIRNRSLLQYRHSLKRLQDTKGVLLPGHGQKVEDIPATVKHHLSEHESRYAEVLQLLEEKPLSLLEIAMQLFPEPMRQGDAFLALSEVMGYLDWGLQEGTIREEEQVNQIRYRR